MQMPSPVALSAKVFSGVITLLEERLGQLDAVVAEKRRLLELEQDPMRNAEMVRDWSDGYWAAARGRAALELIKGETFLALHPKLFPHPCSFCLGHHDAYALENPAAIGFLPMSRQEALQRKTP